MCTRTRIKHVYQGVQGACPWQAVTGAEGECRAVGTGLKLVYLIYKGSTLTKICNIMTKRPSSLYTEPR